jgi:hypothetical protein
MIDNNISNVIIAELHNQDMLVNEAKMLILSKYTAKISPEIS